MSLPVSVSLRRLAFPILLSLAACGLSFALRNPMRGETLSEEVTRTVGRPGERTRPFKEERAGREVEARPGLSERVRERVVEELPRPLRAPQRPATAEPPKLPTGKGRHVVILVEN